MPFENSIKALGSLCESLPTSSRMLIKKNDILVHIDLQHINKFYQYLVDNLLD